MQSNPFPPLYLVTITFDDGIFEGKAYGQIPEFAYNLVLQDARMASARHPQFHGKVLSYTIKAIPA